MCPRYMNVPSSAPSHVGVAGVGKQYVLGLSIIGLYLTFYSHIISEIRQPQKVVRDRAQAVAQAAQAAETPPVRSRLGASC